MPIDLQNYKGFCETLAVINYFESDPGLLPRLTNVAKLPSLVGRGSAFVPQIYQQRYAAPLDSCLPSFLTQLAGTPVAQVVTDLEPYCAPIYQHAKGTTRTDVRPQLQRSPTATAKWTLIRLTSCGYTSP